MAVTKVSSSFLLQVRYNNGNRIDCSCGAVFARWRGLGILLARLTQPCCLILFVTFMRGFDPGIDPRTIFQLH
jgi:hypothetical protein